MTTHPIAVSCGAYCSPRPAVLGDALGTITPDPHGRKVGAFVSVIDFISCIYVACCFDELSRRGSVLSLLNASFEKRFHNATTQVFTPKLMTMASAGAK